MKINKNLKYDEYKKIFIILPFCSFVIMNIYEINENKLLKING